MSGRTSLLRATALALPLSLAAAGAHAASIAETVQQQKDLGTFSKALEAAGLGQQLTGEGPYTVFAPTDQAFEQLPQGALDELMKEENRAELTALLKHHVVQGQEIAADDVLGKQTGVQTMAGDTLTVDGTSEVVLLVPTGLTVARVGDQLVIEREGVAVSTRAIEVQDQAVRRAGDEQQPAEGQQPAAGQQQDQRMAAGAPTAEESDMPMTEHQQEALESEPQQEQQQPAAQGTSDMPASEHQQEVLETEPGQDQQQAASQQQAQGQQGQQTAARTTTAEGSDMPMTEHQQEVLESEPGQEQQQTAAQGSTDMPATEHQQEVLAEEELSGEQQQSYEQARVEGKPDILREATVVEAGVEADNGVIHVIDAVLVPQDVLKTLEAAKQGKG